MLDIREIRKRFEEGYYTYKLPDEISLKTLPVEYVFDENLSVKRNREMVLEWNNRVKEQKLLKAEGQANLNKQLTQDVVNYIHENFNLSVEQAKVVEAFVYSEHHSFMCDYFSYIDTFAELADDLINLSEE